MTRSAAGFSRDAFGGDAGLHVVVEHDAVLVVAHLGLCPNSTGFPSRHSRPGGHRGRADYPAGRPVRCGAGQPLPGLVHDLAGRVEQVIEVVDCADQPAHGAARRPRHTDLRQHRRESFLERVWRWRAAVWPPFAAVSARSALPAFLWRTTARASSRASALRVRSFAIRSWPACRRRGSGHGPWSDRAACGLDPLPSGRDPVHRFRQQP
jgi:hypothetical protein